MRKSTRIVKRLLALFLVVLMSINSFGAVVSDNDGSAFITKAEFDSLKNNFQSQIDQYNTSIDSKIDGAIAFYLAGITVANQTEMMVIGFDKAGVLSPRANSQDLCWKEGILKYDWETWDVRFGNDAPVQYSTYAELKVVGKDPKEFTELCLRNVDRINGYAEWAGVCQTFQLSRAKNALHQRNAVFNYQLEFKTDDWELRMNNDTFRDMMSNGEYYQQVSGNKIRDASTAMFSLFGTRLKNTETTTYSKYMNYESQNFERIINETNNKTIILTPTSVRETRFSDIDAVLDVNNDEFYDEQYLDDAGIAHFYHTHMRTPYEFISSLSSFAFQTTSTTSTQYGNWVQEWVTATPSSIETMRKRTQLYPYFGFVREIRDYNKLWLSKYDDYISDMERTDASLNAINVNGTKHLRLSAGLPICFVKAGTWLELPITFDDRTMNYDLYVKIGSFGATIAPQVDTKCIDNSEIYYGTYYNRSNSEKGTTEKSIKIRNGNGKIVFQCQEDGYIFLKWSIAGNSGAGGGRLLIPRNVTIITE